MHVVLRERIIWDRPGTDQREASRLYSEVERFHDRAVVPGLASFLDESFSETSGGIIDRLELELHLPPGASLSTLNADAVRASLLLGWGNRGSKDTAEPPAPRPLGYRGALNHFLSTGCLPPECTAIEVLLHVLPEDWPVEAREMIRSMPSRSRKAADGRLQVLIGRRGEAHVTAIAPTPEEHSGLGVGSVPCPPPADPPGDQSSASPGCPTGAPDLLRSGAISDGRPANNRSADPDLIVGNAGLVLLHPYLDYLRATAGAETDDPLAAVLLHYAVFGTADCGEWDLPLIKVLLGGRPTDHVPPPRMPPSATQLRSVDALLDGILEHWAALGSTDRDGLRHNFLQRPGKLESAPGSWLLTVERRAYDMLLDRLPWPYTTVKTGAMALPLYVNWT